MFPGLAGKIVNSHLCAALFLRDFCSIFFFFLIRSVAEFGCLNRYGVANTFLSNNRSRESLVVLTLSAAFGTIKSLLINNL